MALLAGWLWFPLVLAAVSLGCGLLVERLAGARVPGALLLPLGAATVLVVARLVTTWEATAPLALPALLALAVAGFVVGLPRLRGARRDRWAAAAWLGAFAVFGAPVLLGGEPTFAGYTLLPDTSHQFALASFLPDHGHAWQQLANSSYKIQLQKYLATAYPVSGQSAIGTLAPLGLLNLPWLYQPFLSFLAASLALTLYVLVEPWVPSRPVRALIAFIACQPALVVSFALQGSIKELGAATMLPLTATLIALALRRHWPARAYVMIGIASAAALGALGPAAGAYLAPLLLVLAAGWAWHLRRRGFSRSELLGAVAATLVAALLALPILGSASTAYSVNTATLQNKQDLGNLAGPLKTVQASGVWLNGDYRYEPARHRKIAYGASVFACVCALLGLLWALRRRALGPLLLAGATGLTSLYLATRGSPYADAKILMVVSPAVLLLAALGAYWPLETGRRVLAAVLGLGLAGSVLLSNALAYHDVQRAPRDRYEELLKIDDRFAGHGPAIMTEYDEFGAYFLHKLRPYVQPEFPHGYRNNDGYRKAGLLDPAHRPSIKTPLDLDDLTTQYVQSVPLLVVRRSPTVSRPPSNYRRVFAGHDYEVWQRRPGSLGTVLAHVPAGRDVFHPGDRPRCSDVHRLQRQARRVSGRLAYVERPPLVRVDPRRSIHPEAWFQYGAYPDSIVTVGQGAVISRVTVSRPARYRLWVDGSFGRRLSVSVDGRPAGSVAYQQGNPGQYVLIGDVALRRGRHEVRIETGGGDLRPGNGGSDSSLRYLGPLVLSPPANESRRVRYVAPARAGGLCGKSVDWIEVVRG
jgi:hypothetical protein